VSTDTSNLAVNCIFNKHFTAFFHRYPSQIRPLGFRVSTDLHALHFAQKDILPVVTPSHPLWLYSIPVHDLSLSRHAKSDTSPEIFQSNFMALCYELSHYHRIYTEGSKMNNSVSAAAVRHEETKSLQIPDKASIFTAELVAHNLALDIVWHSRHKKFVIFSDSLFCVLAIQNLQAESGYVMKFLKNYTALVNTGKIVLLCWVPGHVGIKGNEQVDNVAKMTLLSSISAVKYARSDLYHDIMV